MGGTTKAECIKDKNQLVSLSEGTLLMVLSSSLTKTFIKAVGTYLFGGFLLLCQIWMQSSVRKDFLTKHQQTVSLRFNKNILRSVLILEVKQKNGQAKTYKDCIIVRYD